VTEENLLKDNDSRAYVQELIDKYHRESFLKDIPVTLADPFLSGESKEEKEKKIARWQWKDSGIDINGELKVEPKTQRAIFQLKRYPDPTKYEGIAGTAHELIVEKSWYGISKDKAIENCKIILKTNGCPEEALAPRTAEE
jgi:hypothetical protein